MTDAALQRELFNIIKGSLQSHVSLADEMADLLNLSHDSVYRRIRGEITDKAFNNFWNLVSRSILISETGEKERNKFFNSLGEKIQACKY